MIGAHAAGSPFRLLVVPDSVSANASVAYGDGLVSSIAGAPEGTSNFIIRQAVGRTKQLWMRIFFGFIGDTHASSLFPWLLVRSYVKPACSTCSAWSQPGNRIPYHPGDVEQVVSHDQHRD